MHFKTGRLLGMAAAVCFIVSAFLAVLLIAGAIVPPYPAFNEIDFPPGDYHQGRLDYR